MTFDTSTRVDAVKVIWDSGIDQPVGVRLYTGPDDDDLTEIANFSLDQGDLDPDSTIAYDATKKALRTAIWATYDSDDGFRDSANERVIPTVSGHPFGVTDPKQLERYGQINPLDRTSYARMQRWRRLNAFWFDLVPAYNASTVYTEQGAWVLHNGSVYVKKNTGTTSNVAPGSANNTHWALLLDGTDGVLGGAQGGGGTKVFGPVYRRTNSSTRPATPADDAGTVGQTSGITAAPSNWSTAQVQPTATNQYVYVSFVWLDGTTWKWTIPILTAQYQVGEANNLPDPPANAAEAKKYNLNVPATSGDPTWTEDTGADPTAIGAWDATTTYARGDIILSHGTLCILSAETSLNQAPETNPSVWVRIRNAAVPWRAASTYALGEHVSHNGKLYVLKVASATGIDPSLANQTSWVQIGGPAPEHVEGILTRSETELLGSDEFELDPDTNTLLLASASVPTETAGRFDDRVRFYAGELNSATTTTWVPIADLDALTASDTYDSANSILMYSSGTHGTFRALKIANGNLVVRKTAGTGTTEFEVYIDHIYWYESMDRVQEVLREIVGQTGGSSFRGAWVSGTTYNRGDVTLHSNVLWILYGAATRQSTGSPNADPLNWYQLGRAQDWSSGHTYRAGAIVIGSDDNVYACIRDANTSTNPTTNTDQWVFLEPNRPGLTWNNARTYRRGNIVHSGASLYICKAATSTGTDPTGDSQADWQVLGDFSAADRTTLEALENAPKGILTKVEAQLVSGDAYSLAPSTDAMLLPGADVPQQLDTRYDDRFRIRVGLADQTLTELWITIAQLRALVGNDGFNTSNAIPLHSETGYSFWLRRVGNGNLVVFRYGGTGTVQAEVHIDHHYFTETVDRVEEALREITDTPNIDESRLLPAGGWYGQVLTETSATTVRDRQWRHLPRYLPPASGQFGVYRRIENDTVNVTDLASGRIQFYKSSSTGGTEGTDRETIGTQWADILGTNPDGYGTVTDNNKRRFMLLHKTENRGKDLRPFFTQLGQNYWTYPLQVVVFADHDQWALLSGNLIGNSATVWQNHFNFYIDRVIEHSLYSTTQMQSAIPYDIQIKWGFQGDNDTVPAQRVNHVRFRLGGANQPTLPTLGGWDGSAFATGSANQTTQFPPNQDESTSTHLWIFHATSDRAAGPAGAWTTTAWTARRATDPDSTTFSAQYSSTGTGGWTSNRDGIGNAGYMRFRLDTGEWFGPVRYGILTIPTLEVQYSATETGTYTSTPRTSGYFRFRYDTGPWIGPSEIGATDVTIPSLQVQYSANETGPWAGTTLTDGYFRFRYDTGPWIGPAEIGPTPVPTIPTLEVQYSATETGTYTSTVRTDGFFRFRYNGGAWIGPSAIGGQDAVAIPTLEVRYSASETGPWSTTVLTDGFLRFRYDGGTWIGPLPIGAPQIPTLDVQYSATETGTYTSTVRTTGFFRFRYNGGPWIGPSAIGGADAVTIPTLDVQYSATEGGSYTSTPVRTEGFFRFRYNSGPWIGPSEIGATDVDIPTPTPPYTPPSWSVLYSQYYPNSTKAAIASTLTTPFNLDALSDIEILTTHSDGTTATHRMRAADVPITNHGLTDSGGTPIKTTHTRDGLQVATGNALTDSGTANGRAVGTLYFRRQSGVTSGRVVGVIVKKGLAVTTDTTLHATVRGR